MGAGLVELLLPGGEAPRGFLTALAGRLDVVSRTSTRTDRTYLDTFDGRLHAKGWRLFVSGAARGASTNGNAATLVDRSGAVATAAELHDRLARVVEPRVLQPQVRVRTASHAVNVLNDDRKTVARVEVIEPVAVATNRKTVPLRPRVVLHEVRGYTGAFARTQRVLERDLGLVPAELDVVDEAMMAVGRPVGGVSSALDIKLDPGVAAGHAVTAVFGRLMVIIEANVPGVLADTDIEFLHDLRVAVRRSRSLVKQLAAAMPADTVAYLREELRWLQQVTGPTRDLDVHVLDLAAERSRLPELTASHLDPVAATLAARRRAEYRKMVRALRSDRFARLAAAANALVVSGIGPEAGPVAHQPIARVAGARVAKLYGRMVTQVTAIDDHTPDEALHDLRKQGKELRYVLEMFGSALPEAVLQPLLSSLKGLQDRLGEFNDRHVQAAFLWQVSHELPPSDGWGPALMAAGVIVERLHREQAAARELLPGRFAVFASKDMRRRVRELKARR